MQGGGLSRVVERYLMPPTFQDKLLAHTNVECPFLREMLKLHASVPEHSLKEPGGSSPSFYPTNSVGTFPVPSKGLPASVRLLPPIRTGLWGPEPKEASPVNQFASLMNRDRSYLLPYFPLL